MGHVASHCARSCRCALRALHMHLRSVLPVSNMQTPICASHACMHHVYADCLDNQSMFHTHCGAAGVMFTVIWEAIVPTSVFWALIPPLWAAWTLYDNWIQSPFMLGLLIMLPLKFPPFGPWRWF